MKGFKTDFYKRKKNAHKGDFGHIFVLAGSKGFTGAAYLCAQGALLSGAGLVTLGIPNSLNVIVARKLTEAMTRPLPENKSGALSLAAFTKIKQFLPKVDILAIGPGLSQHSQTQRLIRKIISQLERPMVIDADGLNALKGHLDILKKTKSVKILTPHPGEMARLLGTNTKNVQNKRTGLAKKLSAMYNIITILKGHGTVVAAPDGRLYINKTGNPGMAKGGTGDVLTGIIAAFLAQRQEPFEAAKLAVHVHGLAADLAIRKTGQLSLLASDILDKLPQAIKKLKAKS